jgi:hypothetical protein
MKFYETHFEDYCKSHEQHASACEEHVTSASTPPPPPQNWIVYGPSGVGKYTRVLSLLKPYSPSQLKHDKKIKATTDKQSYTYRISDIHYEVDMALLGCNSKIIWHEIYKQIVDIITIKPDKKLGFIVCKNFHAIHNELLEIFYSYMQQYCYGYEGRSREVQIYFILVTEHVSFLPNNILNRCQLLRVPRPRREDMTAFSGIRKDKDTAKVAAILKDIQTEDVQNLKEIYSFSLLSSSEDLPQDHFNMVCDTIIDVMEQFIAVCAVTDHETLVQDPPTLTHFRDCLYDILIYNLDGIECIWCIFRHFVVTEKLSMASPVMTPLMYKLANILKQYGNNYRSIFHLENAVFSMLNAIIHREGEGRTETS